MLPFFANIFASFAKYYASCEANANSISSQYQHASCEANANISSRVQNMRSECEYFDTNIREIETKADP